MNRARAVVQVIAVSALGMMASYTLAIGLAPPACPVGPGNSLTARAERILNITLTPPNPYAHLQPPSPNATPRLDEALGVGDFRCVPAPTDATPSYAVSLRAEPGAGAVGSVTEGRVVVTHAGRDVVLGPEGSVSSLVAQDARWVIWRTSRSTGKLGPNYTRSDLYAYDTDTGESIQLAQAQRVPYAVVSGDHVLYADETGVEYSDRYLGVLDDETVSLRLYDLTRRVSVLLSSQLPTVSPGRRPVFFALSDRRAVWFEYTPQDRRAWLMVHEFRDGSTRRLDVDTSLGGAISTAGDLLVWAGPYWRGYDFARGAPFTLPSLPVAYASSAGYTVIARPDGVQWEITVAGAEDRPLYLFAPVEPRSLD